jgi:hypothetical protein
MSHRAWVVIRSPWVSLVGPAVASAHIFIRCPTAGRSHQPAGRPVRGSARGGAPATVYAPGQTIMVGWTETIDHRHLADRVQPRR